MEIPHERQNVTLRNQLKQDITQLSENDIVNISFDIN